MSRRCQRLLKNGKVIHRPLGIFGACKACGAQVQMVYLGHVVMFTVDSDERHVDVCSAIGGFARAGGAAAEAAIQKRGYDITALAGRKRRSKKQWRALRKANAAPKAARRMAAQARIEHAKRAKLAPPTIRRETPRQETHSDGGRN